MFPAELAAAARTGNLRAIARAATIIENDVAAGQRLIAELFPYAGHAHLLGITGPAGAGKSTLVNACVRHLRTQSLRVAVIAVDPTSPLTRGALLGDRVRMSEHWSDPGVYVRSLATRGYGGGLSAAVLDIAILLDAAGFDFIFIETIGAGQDEVAITSLAQATALVVTPGAGDDIQASKAGIIEVADIIVVNKADLDGADRVIADLRFAQDLDSAGKHSPIIKVSATLGTGIEEFMNKLSVILDTQATYAASVARWTAVLRHMVRDIAAAALPSNLLEHEAALLIERQGDPHIAAQRLLSELASH